MDCTYDTGIELEVCKYIINCLSDEKSMYIPIYTFLNEFY